MDSGLWTRARCAAGRDVLIGADIHLVGRVTVVPTRFTVEVLAGGAQPVALIDPGRILFQVIRTRQIKWCGTLGVERFLEVTSG